MTNETKARIVRCAELCEFALGVESDAVANNDLDGAAEAADAAGYYAEHAFALAIPTADNWA